MDTIITYFEKPGPANTETTLLLAKRRASELRINKILVASTSGATACKAISLFDGFTIVAVTHHFGAREPNTLEFTDENRRMFEEHGGKILTTTHGFGGIGRLRSNLPSQDPQSIQVPALGFPRAPTSIGDIIVSTLEIIGRGTKVVCEIVAMATDAGLVRTDEYNPPM
jgi:hypothetical protein